MTIRPALFALTLLALSSAACLAPAVAVTATNNEDVAVETLFTHDGCTVYRFRDGGYHYYARCSGAQPQVQTMSLVSCGKNCKRPDDVATYETER